MSDLRFRIIYHFGREIDIKTKVESGFLIFSNQSILIEGKNYSDLPFSSFRQVELFRLNGLGRMIKLECVDCTIFLSVVWLNISGYFAIINFFGTGKLFEKLKKKALH